MEMPALAFLFASPLSAAPILQDNWDNSHTIKFFNAFGRSFTAEDAAIASIGFSVAVADADFSAVAFTVGRQNIFQVLSTTAPIGPYRIIPAARSTTMRAVPCISAAWPRRVRTCASA